MPTSFAPGGSPPTRATSRSGRSARAEQQQADQRLRVARLLDRLVEPRQRPRDDLDALVLVGLGARVRQPGREEQLDALVREARARVEPVQRLPPLGGLADLLG